jgi:hydroxymethylbilane synthase
LWQAHWVQRELLKRNENLQVTIGIIKTKGDKVLDSPLSKIGDKGLFTREIELALLSEEIDVAVHSLKDLPTQLPHGLTIGAICEREDVRDVFLPHPANPAKKLQDQLHGATIATGSLRRKCQLLRLRNDFRVIDIRGNLNTRLKKLQGSDWAGMILARAGVVRLGWETLIGETLDAEIMLPAVGQGALAIEVRTGDQRVMTHVGGLTHVPTLQATVAERALLRTLEGGCQIPVGTFARVNSVGAHGPELSMDAMVGSLDGQTIVRAKTNGDPAAAEAIGRNLAETLLKLGADKILEHIRAVAPHQDARSIEA